MGWILAILHQVELVALSNESDKTPCFAFIMKTISEESIEGMAKLDHYDPASRLYTVPRIATIQGRVIASL